MFTEHHQKKLPKLSDARCAGSAPTGERHRGSARAFGDTRRLNEPRKGTLCARRKLARFTSCNPHIQMLPPAQQEPACAHMAGPASPRCSARAQESARDTIIEIDSDRHKHLHDERQQARSSSWPLPPSCLRSRPCLPFRPKRPRNPCLDF